MRFKTPLIIAMVVLSAFGSAQTKVMTYNIRYDNKDDGENCWENRKEELVQLIDYCHPEIFGIQEGLNHQVCYIDKSFSDYSYMGVGREDGNQRGEFSAIFYDSTRFECVENKTFWLSETSNVVSVGWDAALERICTYGQFVNKSSKDTLWVFNAHFDHKGEIARANSARLIIKQIDSLTNESDNVIVMGDFNSRPQDTAILLFKEKFEDGKMVSQTPFCGSEGTFNAFNVLDTITTRLDYIFVKNLTVNQYRHIDDRRKNNLYPSDHFPVIIEVVL